MTSANQIPQQCKNGMIIERTDLHTTYEEDDVINHHGFPRKVHSSNSQVSFIDIRYIPRSVVFVVFCFVISILIHGQ